MDLCHDVRRSQDSICATVKGHTAAKDEAIYFVLPPKPLCHAYDDVFGRPLNGRCYSRLLFESRGRVGNAGSGGKAAKVLRPLQPENLFVDVRDTVPKTQNVGKVFFVGVAEGGESHHFTGVVLR
jgi:hypothetical protein